MVYRTGTRFNEIDRKLLELQKALSWRNMLYSRLHAADRALARERRRRQELEHRARAELEDVKLLEGKGLAAMFHSILGSKEQRLNRERQEYLAARLELQECVASVAAMEREVGQIRDRIDQLEGIRRRQRALVAEKERLIAEDGGPESEELAQLDAGLAHGAAVARELGEALAAGNEAYDRLLKIIELLDRAARKGAWGIRQLQLSRDSPEVEEARRLASQVQQRLRVFAYELEDVGIQLSTHDMRQDIVRGFARVMVGEMIQDWGTRSKLMHTRNLVTGAAHEIWDHLSDLGARLVQMERRLEELARHRHELLHSNQGI